VKLDQSGSLAKTLKTNPAIVPSSSAEIKQVLPVQTGSENEITAASSSKNVNSIPTKETNGE
jgi:hypothetical protein